MALKRFDGPKSKLSGTTVIRIRDAQGVLRDVRIGDQIDLLQADIDRLTSQYNLTDPAQPTPSAPAAAIPQLMSEKGQPNGYPSLDDTGKVPSAQLPASSGGGSGSGVVGGGVWNSGTAYLKGTIVSYLTGSYLALQDVAAGGQSPAVDSAKWQQLVAGGGEIAYAEILASWGMPTPFTANAFVDIPGLSVVIPAGSPAYDVEAVLGAVQVSWGAGAVAGTLADVHIALVDEANTLLAQGLWRTGAPAASGSAFNNMLVKRRMPATATQKAIRVQIGTSMVTNVGGIVVWAGTGAITPPGINNIGPAHMRARAT